MQGLIKLSEKLYVRCKWKNANEKINENNDKKLIIPRWNETGNEALGKNIDIRKNKEFTVTCINKKGTNSCAMWSFSTQGGF